MRPLSKAQANQLDLLVRNTWHYFPGRKYGTRRCSVTCYLESTLDGRTTQSLRRRGLLEFRTGGWGLVVTAAGFKAWESEWKAGSLARK